MTAGREPAFASGPPVWPLAGMTLAGPEPDDPELAIPSGALRKGIREAPERYFAANQNGLITIKPLEALAPRLAKADRSRKWTLALLASCVFHAAAALFFIQATDQDVLMEGADFSGIAYLGSAEDQVEAGEVSQTDEAVDVTMVTMLDAVPVATVDAEAVPVDDRAEAIDVAEAVVPDVETLKPIEETSVERAAEASVEPVQPVEPVEPEAIASGRVPAATENVPQVRATDRADLLDDNVAQQPVTETRAAEPVKSEVTPSARTEQVQAAETEARPVEPVEEPKPPRRAETTRKPVEKVAERAKPARKPEAEKKGPQTTKAVEQPAKAGRRGQNEADARRGQAEGQEKGDSRQASRGGSRNSEVGNAAVSNYPGKVRSKLARVARSVRARGSGDVLVAFSVGSNGGVLSARIARGSGVDSVDQAALQAVQKASPFPPIPANAGRATWEFSVPLAFRR